MFGECQSRAEPRLSWRDRDGRRGGGGEHRLVPGACGRPAGEVTGASVSRRDTLAKLWSESSGQSEQQGADRGRRPFGSSGGEGAEAS